MIPIGRCAEKIPDQEVDCESTFYINPADSKKCASHLHRYFAHSSARKLKDFVKSISLPNEKDIMEALESLDKSCEFCLKHKSREAPHRKIAIPQGKLFNDVVAMDLKKLKCGIWIVHFLDLVTRFSAAASIKSKDSEEILTKTFMYWISVLGRPNTFMSDNGGEFVNKEFNDMCSLLNVNIKTSPAETPWCNGAVERHNGLLAQMIEAIMEDTGCNVDTAIAWATNAKNSLNNVFGFSPYQLVMGRNPKMPEILCYENLPALNSETACQLTADHLNAMESARKKYIELENGQRFKRVMRERVYEASNEKFISGDIVYFKRQKNGWQGPATVVGQLGNQVLIKHGGMLIRMHPCKVVLKSKADNQVEPVTTRCATQHEDTTERINQQQLKPENEYSKPVEYSSSSDSEDSENESDSMHDIPEEEAPAIEEHTVHEEEPSRETSGTVQDVPSGESQEIDQPQWTPVVSQGTSSKVSLKKGDVIRYKDAESEQWEKGLVMSRAGKASGKYKNTFNILKESCQDQVPVNVVDVSLEKLTPQVREEILLIEEESEVFVMKNSVEDIKVTDAKQAELRKFKEFNVYKEVKDVGQSTISTRWVVTYKDDIVKARLVARGFEELSYQQCDAPTVTKPCLRMAFMIACCYKWKIEALDITSAFLQSDKILREVYIKPPSDIRTNGVVWLLNKPLYGLGESARLWYFTLKRELIKLGCKVSNLDKSVFRYYGNNDKLRGIIVTHVDDLFYCGGSNFKRDVIQPILKKFKISRLKTGVFTYLGWSVTQDDDCISVDQSDYAKTIKSVDLPASRKKALDDELTQEEHKQYQSLLGKLLWLSSQTRPDLCFEAMEHSTFAKKPLVKHLLSLNKAIKKLDEGPLKNVFRAMDLEKDRIQILFYSDASLGNLSDKKGSGRGYVVFVTNGKVANPIAWSSNKVKRVVHSVFGAETLGCVDGAGAAINIRQQLSDILYSNPRSQVIPIIGLVDSRQLSDHIISTSQCQDKRIRLDIAELQECVSNGEIERISWVPTFEMLADSLTKKGACSRKLCETLETGHIPGIEKYLGMEKV